MHKNVVNILSNDCCILTLQMLEYNFEVTVPIGLQIQSLVGKRLIRQLLRMAVQVNFF